MDRIPIDKLNISMRAKNVLHRMSIDYVDQLIDAPLEKILGQRNAGLKTVSELKHIIDNVDLIELTGLELSIDNNPKILDGFHFSDEQINEFSRHPIKEIGLPVRSHNALMREGYITIDKVIMMSVSELENLRGLGSKSISETIEIIKQWAAKNCSENKIDVDADKELIDQETKDFFITISDKISGIIDLTWNQIAIYVNQAGLYEKVLSLKSENNINEVIRLILSLPELEGKIRNYFYTMVPDGIVKEEVFYRRLSLNCGDIDSSILIERICNGITCLKKDGYIYICRKRLEEYLEENKNEIQPRYYDILVRRLQGESLQLIADEFELSRERVRQILVKTINKIPMVYEDYYKEPYEAFRFSKEEFSSAFPDCGDSGYEYLFIRYAKGYRALTEDGLNNYFGLFSEKLHDYLEEKINRKDNESKSDIVLRLFVANSDQSLKLEEFERLYYDYIDQHGYSREKYLFNNRTIGNRLRNSKYFLINEDNGVRYCHIDYAKIWQEIDFSKYKDLVLSASRIFNDYKDLMNELDIRDGYELFYAIKSSLEYSKDVNFLIACRRVPVIVFGDGDEIRQAMHLLKELSPIGYYDYFEAYEERFGMHKESVMGNSSITNVLSKYLSKGWYIIDVPQIDDRDVYNLKRVLSQKSIWFMDDLENVFRNVCVNSSEDAFNTAAFKTIGYTINSGYAYSDAYTSVINLFDKEIFNRNIVDISSLDKRLTSLSSFCSALDRKKRSLDYIEISPKVLLSIKEVHDRYGIGIDDIKDFQKRIIESCEDKYFNAHSLWEKIKSDSFVCRLQENEWMCTCILRQQDEVFSMSVANGIILCKNPNELNIGKICEWIVEKKGKMSISSLTKEFNLIFGLNIPNSKIGYKVRSSGKWENMVTDSLDSYIDSLVVEENIEENFFKEEFY